MRLGSLKCAVSLASIVLLAGAALLLRGDDDGQGANVYVQHNLVSDLTGMTTRPPDTRLVNAWGIEHSPTSPWWVNANGTGLSIVYDATGAPAPAAKPLVVTIPAPGGSGTSAPTGIVFNGSMDFQLATAKPALFLFATEDGTIAGWSNLVDLANAVIKVNHSPAAVFKGITLGNMGGHNVIYAANFRGGTVDVFDTNFGQMTLPAGAFHDTGIPAGFAPFNVQNIEGSIFVTYAMQDAAKHDDVAGAGAGYVDRFTPAGVLVTRFEHGNWMNSPWGVAKAPGGFGKLSERLLVGNFGSGQIAAFNEESGKFQSMMNGQSGNPLTINGLWGLKFGNGGAAGPANVLFFAAGIQDEAHGLFGTLTPAANNGDDHGNGDHGDQGNGDHGNGHGGQ